MKYKFNYDEDIILLRLLTEKLDELEICNLKVAMSISAEEGTLFTLTDESGLISCQWQDSESTSDFIERIKSLINMNNSLQNA